MYLSKLEIFGFKSFAQKTVFQFADGLTAIIGPNGCGKSNIVDAVRWVLGEQRPSVLRCERMENLIFNGTATRKPLNMVEVSIYIENTRNILPSEYTEIKITRRLYRSGESEYLINNQTARLMDIVNLFADTGMGADAYSVIELKMVEQILSDNAQERRRLFEEAAGIKRYKARRRSALLKLETTEQELTRVDDIIAEVQKTVNSLSRQVGKARRYHEIKQQLKEKEILLACLKITAFEQELQPLRTEQEQVGKTREMLAKEVHLQEADLEEQRRRLVEMEHQYRQIAAEVYRQDEALKEKQNRRQLRQQRIRSLQETITAYEQELTAQQQKKTHLEAEKAELETSLGQLRQQMSEAQERYRQTANRQLEAREAYEQCREAYQNFIKSNVEALQASESHKEQFQRIRVEKENVQTNLTRLQETQERFLAEARNRQETLDADEATRAALAEDLALYAQEQQLLQERIQESKQGQEALRQQLNRVEGELEKLRNRRSFLENLIRNYEGFSESVQYVMTHRQEFTGIVDTLANLVDCPPEYRPALESYLAEVANYLVVEEVETARKILHQLRHRGKGRLTVVPLPLLRPNHRPGADELPGEGAQGLPLKQVVTFPQSYANLFHALFDAVYLVDDLETAIALRRDYPEVTYVTREGEVLHQWGNLTGGAAANGVGLIGRKEEFRRVEQLIGEKEAHLTALQEKLEQATTTLEAREKKLEEFRQLHQSVQQQLMELEQRIGRQQYEIGRLQETAEELAEQVADHRQRLQELEAQEQQLLPEMTRLEEQARTYQLREQELRQAQQKAETRLQELDEQTRQHQMVYLDLVSREKELLQKVQFTEESLKESEAFMANRRQRIEEAHREIAALEAECAALQTELEAGYRERDALAQQKDDLERKVEEFRAAIQHKETELKKKQRLLVQAR
ncbi:MAG: chromosome segregation protein SMC, partial [Calditrichaeota bacterium]